MFPLFAANPVNAAGPKIDLVAQTNQLARQQAQAALKTLAALKQNSAQTIGELAKRAKKDPNVSRVINHLTTSPETGSLQLVFNGSSVKVAANSLTDMTGKAGQAEIAAKAKGSKNRAIKDYYGTKGPAMAFLKSNQAIAAYTTALFKASSQKQVDTAAKKSLRDAVAALTPIADKVTPEGAKAFAEHLGSLKGLIEQSGAKAQIDAKTLAKLDAMISTVDEFETAKGVVEGIAKKFAALMNPKSDLAKEQPDYDPQQAQFSPNQFAQQA